MKLCIISSFSRLGYFYHRPTHLGFGKNSREWLAACFCWYPRSFTNYVNYTSFVFCSLYCILDSIPKLGVGLWFYYRFYLSEDFIFLFSTMNFPVASQAGWVRYFLVIFHGGGSHLWDSALFRVLAFNSGPQAFANSGLCLSAKTETLTPIPYIHTQWGYILHVQGPSWRPLRQLPL